MRASNRSVLFLFLGSLLVMMGWAIWNTLTHPVQLVTNWSWVSLGLNPNPP